MANQQIGVNMKFTADTGQAKAQIQELQTSLMRISTAGSMGNATKDMQAAAGAAKELSYHLNQAFNANTGRFDLSRLDKSLKTSGTNVTKLSGQLLSAGKTGQQAFVQLAQSIAAADRPMLTLSSRMSDLMTTMKNTAKWQLSSSVLHGFMGAVQTAYGYAQDLNESLNNIRIVTGANINEMARFAQEANKAAKALSSTTTDYTNASLIYYQQGLNDSQVKERTDITIKMANVARQSAEVVSDQMTAVWNNFDNGSKSLEYYADVMTALGAATASSTDEIATGLEKFAAVSETVGLSYEYATAALATVTDKTRQSADVVGTAFKTMFARIQGLKLGETLEDGTDFNQYSEALMAVGVNIKTANGELKDMDTILNEMAAVWETLNRDEQVALAQKVAGVRQYNQLVSLMENWDAMEINLKIAGDSEGTLQEQADIYAESWEAAQNRVRASMESIYSDLINDEFFIDLSNGFASLIDSLDAFIDGFGGVKMIIASVASILMATFAHKVPGAIENLKANFSVLFKGASTQAQSLAKDMIASTQAAQEKYAFNTSSKTALENATALNTMNNKLAAVKDKMTDKERQQYQQEVEILKVLEQETQEMADAITKRQQELDLIKEEVQLSEMPIKDERAAEEERLLAIKQQKKQVLNQAEADPNKTGKIREAKKAYDEASAAVLNYQRVTDRMSDTQNAFIQDLFDSCTQLDKVENGLVSVGSAFQQYTEGLETLGKGLGKNTSNKNIEQVKSSLQSMQKEINQITKTQIPGLDAAFEKAFKAKGAGALKQEIKNIKTVLEQAKIPADQIKKIMETFGFSEQFEQYASGAKKVNSELEKLRQKQAQINQVVKDFNPTHIVTGLERITQTAAGLGQIAMIIQSFRSMIDAWNNDDLSFGEKLTTTFMSISMFVPSAIGALKSFNTVLSAEGKTLLGQIALRKTYQSLLQNNTTAKIVNTTAEKLNNQTQKEGNKIDEEALLLGIQKQLIEKGVVKDITDQTMSLNILNLAKLQSKKATEGETVASGQLTLARILENAASQSLLVTLKQLAILYGPYIAIAGLAVGAIAGIVAIIKQLEENSLENQFERASEAAKEAADNYDETKKSLEEIKSTIEDLKTIEDPFKELNKGTVEWSSSLLEANNEITKLINKYPELIKYVKESSSVPGLKVISQDGYDYLEQMASNMVSSAAANSFIAQNNKLELSNKKLINGYEDRAYITSERDVKWYEVFMTNFAKSAQEQGQPNNSSLLLATVPSTSTSQYEFDTDVGFKDVHRSNLSDAQVEKIVIQMVKAGQDARTAAEEVGFSNENLLEMISNNNDELDEIARQYAQNLIAIKENTAAIIDNTNSSNDNYNDSEYKDFIQATNIDSRIEKEKEELQKKSPEDLIADYEQYLKDITGTEHKVEGGKVKKYDEETGTYSEIGDYAADKALDILAKAAAYKFSDKEIEEIEQTGKTYEEEVGKLKVTDENGDEIALTEQQIKDIALGIYTAEQEGSQFNIGNVLNELGTTYSVNYSGMGESMQNQFSSVVQDQTFTTEGFAPDQQNLIDFAEGYEIAKEKVEEYKESLGELTYLEEKLNKLSDSEKKGKKGKELEDQTKAQKKLIAAQEDELRALSTVGKAAEKYGLNEKELLIQSKQLAKQYKLTAEQAANMAVKNQRMNKGVTTLADNWKSWKKTLNATDSTTIDYANTVAELTSAIADLVGAPEDLELPEEFLKSSENMDLLSRAAKGSSEAINLLGINVAKQTVDLMDYNHEIAAAYEELGEPPPVNLIDANQFDAEKQKVLAGIEDLKNKVKNGTQEVGGEVSSMNADWINSLNNMAAATGMSVQDMNSLLSELGVQTEVKTVPMKQKRAIPIYETTTTVINPGDEETGDGRVVRTTTTQQGTKDMWEKVEVAQIGAEGSVDPPKVTYVGGGSVAPSSTGGGGGGGGGGGSTSPAKPTKKSEVVDRYKEQDDRINSAKHSMDMASSSLDRLYGPDKVAAVQRLVEAEKEYTQALRDKQDAVNDALAEDREALDEAAKAVNIKFTYDEEGNITNYTAEMEDLYSQLSALEKAAGSEWSESEQKQIDALKEKIDTVKEAYEQYEETKELLRSIGLDLDKLAGKPALPMIKSDYVDIYREVNDLLDDIDAKLERIIKKNERLLGSTRLEDLDTFLQTRDEKIDTINTALSNNKKDVNQNKTNLREIAKVLGIEDLIEYDENGNITNYDEIAGILYQRAVDAKIAAKGKDSAGGSKITEAEQQGIDTLLDDVSLWTEATDQYQSSVEYREDLKNDKSELTAKVKVLPVVTSDFFDIYKETDDLLDDIEEKINKISKEADRLTGKDKVAKLKELAKLEEEKLEYIRQQQEINNADKKEKRNALGKARRTLGIETKFKIDDKTGTILNYDEVMAEYKQRYDDAYAKMLANDGKITADEKEWLDQFLADGQQLEEYIQQYSEAVEKGEDLEAQAQDAMYAAEDYILEALSYTIELNIEVNDRDLALIEHQLSQLQDEAYATAEVMSLIQDKFDALNKKAATYTNGITQIMKNAEFTDEEISKFLSGDIEGLDLSKLTQAELDKLNEYADGLLEVNENLLELRNTMDEAVIKAFEEWTAEMQEQLAMFEHYNSIINSYNNIIDLAGKERLGITDEQMVEYKQLNVTNATNKVTSSKAYFEEVGVKISSAEAEKAAAESRLADAQSSGDESAIKAAQQDVKMWEDTLKTMRQEQRNAEQQYLSDWEAALQAARDAFLAETDMQLKQLEEKMAGTYGTIANMQEAFKRESEVRERYLQDYEKIYELSKLNRELMKKMDETSNLKAKREMANLQEEILKYQKEGREMSDYDLKYLKKKYELKLAEIALEESQKAKTQVRLTRDSEGNYSYTYTADEDSMAKAQQTYEDKLYEITNLSNEYIESQTSKLLSAQQEYISKLAEIHKKAAEGQYATTAEYQQALDECTAYYTDLMTYYGGEIDKAANNNASVYENDYLTYSGFALEKAGATQAEVDAYLQGIKSKTDSETGFITSITELLPGLEDAHISAAGYVETMVGAIGSAKGETGFLGAASKSYKELGANIDGVMSAAGTSVDAFAADMYKKFITDEDSIANASEATKNNILAIVDATDKLDDTISQVSAWQEAYSAELQKLIDKAILTVGAINDLNRVIAEGAEGELNDDGDPPGEEEEDKCPICGLKDCKGHPPAGEEPAGEEPAGEEPAGEEPAGDGTGDEYKKLTSEKVKGIATAIWCEPTAGWGTGETRRKRLEKVYGKDSNVYDRVQAYINKHAYNGDLYDRWVNTYKKNVDKYHYPAFDTGGYTGSWGSEGKLAMLHEKELVLNKQDTENVLKIVSIVRDLSAALDEKAYYASLAQLQASQLYQVTSNGETFEQTVTIHAEFPNASSASEIETALNNLVNSASQYSNRK